MKIPDIKYETVNLSDVIMHRADPDNNARVVTSIEVNGTSLISTQRFMTSFRIGLGSGAIWERWDGARPCLRGLSRFRRRQHMPG